MRRDRRLCVICGYPVDTTRTGAIRVDHQWAHDVCVSYARAHPGANWWDSRPDVVAMAELLQQLFDTVELPFEEAAEVIRLRT